LVSRAQARAEGFADFRAYVQALNERFPLRFEGDPAPRIREGALCLNDPAEAEVCLATFQVNRNSANAGEASGESGLNKS
jgi:hypothetical protein